MINAVLEAQSSLHQGALDALNAFRTSGVGAPALIASAFVFGLLHALLPGHGKAVLASFYAADGRWRGAVASSGLLIAVHVGVAVVLVLTGAAILQRTLVGAGRAPVLEMASNALIALVGAWLLFRAVRPHGPTPRGSGPVLGAMTGLVPCPLTTFIMTFAVANDAIGAGLLLAVSFGVGMIATVAAFPLGAVVLRSRLRAIAVVPAAARTIMLRSITAASAGAILLLGLVPLVAA
ncbi:MAG: sulfite exporter TauE/SafE family protein [Parvibaculaceae bacterium]